MTPCSYCAARVELPPARKSIFPFRSNPAVCNAEPGSRSSRHLVRTKLATSLRCRMAAACPKATLSLEVPCPRQR
eukprot:scaffold298895_cov31-Tisochrysis_lutea.AAC.2